MDPTSLIHRYLLGDVSEDEVRELDRLLADSPELRREFVLAAAEDAGLRETAFEHSAEPQAQHTQTNRRSSKSVWAAWIAAAATIAAVLAAGFFLSGPAAVATLTSSENAAWESVLPTTPGSELIPGLLKLKSGVATIRFHSGAEVLLEAPAELELVTSMKGRLTTGAAVVDVPEPAVGFVIETPDGYVVDYGTRFAVKVNQPERTSDFEIIEGEIAVHHPLTGNQVRLTGQGKTATISNQALIVDPEQAETDSKQTPNIIRLGTNGRAGSVIRNNKRKKFIRPEVLSVKRTELKNWDHRSFFEFDLSETDLSQVDSARLRLNLVPSTRGFAARLPKINRFGIYGLTNPAKADWKIESLWEEAPAPEDGVLLGTFEIPRSRQRGSYGIQNDRLLDFLREHQGSPVTLILVRETSQIEGTGPGLTHMFAGVSHPEAVGPTLEFSVRPPAE